MPFLSMKLKAGVMSLVTLCLSGTIQAQFNDPSFSSDVYAVREEAQANENKKIARAWNLSIEQVERYQDLMIVEKHYAAENISPIEVLGKNARTFEEMESYAILARERLMEQTLKSIEWGIVVDSTGTSNEQNAFEMVSKSPVLREFLAAGGVTLDRFEERYRDREYGPGSVISEPSLDFGERNNNLDSLFEQSEKNSDLTRRFMFANAIECDEKCEELWSSLRDDQEAGIIDGIDVIFIDFEGVRPSKDQVSTWAVNNDVSVNEVKDKTVTLNWSKDEYMNILGDHAVPVVFSADGVRLEE